MHFHRHCMHDIRNCISFDANITCSVIVHTQCLYPVPNPTLNIRPTPRICLIMPNVPKTPYIRRWMHDIGWRRPRGCLVFIVHFP